MKKKFLAIIALLLFLSSILTCCKPESQPGSIFGTVVDKSTTKPVSGAGVELLPNGLKNVTGSDGTFEFTQIDPGDYNIYVTKTGYQDMKSSTIVVRSGEQAHGDVQIEKLPASLQVLDNDGNVITELDFGGDAGVVSKTFKLYNRGDESFRVTIYKDVDWIESITPSTGTVPINGNFPVIIKINREKLTNGINTTSIIISSETVGGVELTVKATKGSTPTVVTTTITDVTATSAVVGGNVTSNGNINVTQTGVCYSTSQNPTISNHFVVGSSNTGAFTCSITGLSPSTKYYVRAYATNGAGTAYGEQKEFTTNSSIPTFQYAGTTYYVHPEVGTMTWQSAMDYCDNLTYAGHSDWFLPDKDELQAMYVYKSQIGGFVTTYNSSPIECCYWCSTELDYNNAYRQRFDNGSWDYYGKGSYYRVRPVRKDGGGGGTTPTAPTVTTNEPSNVTNNSATCGGNVTSEGGADVIQRGVCYSTSQAPTTSNQVVTSGTGTGTFTCNLTGLSSNTTYYVRAYAINSVETSYGAQKSFTTGSGGGGTTPVAPTVTTIEPTNVTNNSATCGGNVTSDGGANVIQRGVCYSTSPNPTTSSQVVTSGTGTGSFTCNLTGLSANTTYYVRAYAINSAGTGYGTQKSFTTGSGGGGSAPSAPTGVSATVGGSRIIVSWNSVSNADDYIVYWSNNGSSYIDIGTTSDLYFYDDAPSEDNYYKVKARNNYGESAFSSPVYCHYSSGGNVDGWLQYDDGNGIDALGFTNGGTIYWANMFPTSMLGQYVGTSIVEIEALLNSTGTYTLQIYSGGTSSPGTLVAEINFTHNYSEFGWYTMSLPNAVTLDTSHNLWIVISKTHSSGEYPAGVCADSGDSNGRWLSDGSGTWVDMGQAHAYTWGIHTYVSNHAKIGKREKVQIISAQIMGSKIPNP